MLKILIVAHGLDVKGGIGNCLYRMIEAIVNNAPRYEVDLLLSDPESIVLAKKEFPTVNTLPQNKFINTSLSAKELLKDAITSKNLNLLWARLLYKFDYKLPLTQAAVEDLPILEGEYDAAISYSAIPSPIANYVALKVHAKLKIAWAHTEIDQSNCSSIPGFSALKVRGLKQYQTILEKYDNIVSVSKGVQSSIEHEFPRCDCKKQVIYNLTGKERVIRLADEYTVERGAELQLLTVGRCSYEKGIDIATETAELLVNQGVKFKWWFVGFSNDIPPKVMAHIRDKGLGEYLVFLGTKENPYPYFKACDIYVHTSRVEGYCTTVNEARMLGKPIITTNAAGADEQIQNGKNGFVVNKDPRETADAIIALANDEAKMKAFADYNKSVDFEAENKDNLSKILALLELERKQKHD